MTLLDWWIITIRWYNVIYIYNTCPEIKQVRLVLQSILALNVLPESWFWFWSEILFSKLPEILGMVSPWQNTLFFTPGTCRGHSAKRWKICKGTWQFSLKQSPLKFAHHSHSTAELAHKAPWLWSAQRWESHDQDGLLLRLLVQHRRVWHVRDGTARSFTATCRVPNEHFSAIWPLARWVKGHDIPVTATGNKDSAPTFA